MGERVYFRRYQPWDVSVGVVVGAGGVLLVDTRGNDAEAEELLADLCEIDRRPPRWVVNTHDHFDHIGGNVRVAPAEVLDRAALGTGDRAVVDLGDRSVVVRYLGRGHTGGDVVAAVPDADVVFAGDLVEESAPPAYGDDSHPLDWPLTNARLVGLLSPRMRVVPGHGAAVDRNFVAAQQKQLDAVARMIRTLWVGEIPVESALNTGQWPWPTDLLADAVARGYEQLATDRGS